MMSQYGMNYGYMPQQSYGVVANSPNYTGGNLYGYNDSTYGLYGQNPWMTLAESPYARLTGQNTQFSSQAIPNLSSFVQPMMVDMNGFLGNSTGIPAYPSFIGSTAMQNSNVPLYQTYQQYQQQQQPQYSSYPTQSYGYPQQSYSSYPTQQYSSYPQQSYSSYPTQQYSSYPQQNYGYQTQQNPFTSYSGVFPGTSMNSFSNQQTIIMQNNYCFFG